MSPITETTMATARGVLAAEYTKLRSLRSWPVTVLATALATVAFGVITANDVVTYWGAASPSQRASFDPIWVSLTGSVLAQLVFGVLGILAISSEYTTGSIRMTFTAVPQRWTVLAAKATVVAAATLLAGELIAVTAFLAGQATLSARDIDVPLTHPGVLRGLLGAGFFLTVMALFGLGLGAIIRHTAGAVSALVGLIFLLPPVVQALPTPWDIRIGRYLLPEPGRQMILLHHAPGQLAVGPAFLVCAVYAITVLLLAGLLLMRRDV
jgi:hypothetical protein